MSDEPILGIRPYTPDCWSALWRICRRQLAEAGIIIPESALPGHPLDARPGDHEWDYHQMDRVYLSGRGGFWLAWAGATPVGHVGAQDLGEGVELRRMYVVPEHRRLGAATMLVRALIAHCASRGVRAIELWTGRDGPGRRVYERCGFLEVAAPSPELARVSTLTLYEPRPDEIRMRLNLAEPER